MRTGLGENGLQGRKDSFIQPARSGMDRETGKTRVYERAETGKPLAAYQSHGMRGSKGSERAAKLDWYERERSNGPARASGSIPAQRQGPVAEESGGHKISAIGLPLPTAASGGTTG